MQNLLLNLLIQVLTMESSLGELILLSKNFNHMTLKICYLAKYRHYKNEKKSEKKFFFEVMGFHGFKCFNFQ